MPTILLAAVLAPASAQTDIDVLYIQKTPVLNYDAQNGGWPVEGSVVTWNARVKNWGSSPLASFTCEWRLDGQKVQTDVLTGLAPGEIRNVTFDWIWQQTPHILEFCADTEDIVSEITEANNVHSITTNALTIGSWVEQSLYDWFHAHQIELGDGANSFDNWCYRMVRRWNELNELAVWPASPNGIVDRVRIEKIVVVPDGALPLNGGLATNNPDRYDKTVDLMWGHPYNPSDCQTGGFWQVSTTGPFFIDYGEIHELNHARYLVDHYGFDVSHDQTTSNILLTDQYGNQVAGTALMPYSAWNVVYYNKSADIMGGSNHFGEYAAGAWNRKAGIRGPKGNQNSPPDIGAYLQDLPRNNFFRFIDNTGSPLVGATISVYQATGGSGWYAKYFDNTADIVATTDASGTVNLGRCPFSSTGVVTSGYGLSNATFIIKVSHAGQEYFTFQEVSDFGINYWKGCTQSAYYTILVPWGPGNTLTPVGPNQWRQEIYANKYLGNLVDVKALEPDELGGFALRMADRPISSAVSKDNFSCSFRRDVFFNKGVYRFVMHTDDGGLLFVDGVNHISDWADGGATPRLAEVSFDAPALRTIQMDYYESGSVAIAALAIIPPLDTEPGPNDWRVEVFGSPDLSNLVEVAACPASSNGGFALNWGERGPSVRTGGDGWSVRFSRTIHSEGGTHRFTTVSDDGVRLYIDGGLMIDNWVAHEPTEDFVDIELSAGQHELVVETFDSSGPAQVSLTIDQLMPDFDVTYISRTPRHDRYNVSYEYGVDPNEPETGRPYLTAEEQGKQRWPKPGETVTYTAHVRNAGVSAAPCDYAWYFDGGQVDSGTIATLSPGEEAAVSYSRAWDSEVTTHHIRFAADPQNLTLERCEANNVREDATNALSFRLHVWQGVHDWFAANVRDFSADLVSFEDWAQKNFAHMNQMLADAVYPGTPQGIPERVRIDEIVVESDSTPDPDPVIHAPDDWPWDGRLGFTNDLVGAGGGENYFEQNPRYVSGHDPEFIRRLAPQLGLVDYNALSVEKTSNLAAPTVGHLTTLASAAVSVGGPFFAEHEAYALAGDAHKRRGFSGACLYDLPRTVRLQTLDAYRRPLPGARVKIYQEYPGRAIPASLRFDLTTDAQGYVDLPNRSCHGEFTTATGHTLRDNPFGLVNTTGENGLFFAEITSGAVTDYQFIEIIKLNTAYWLGHADKYTYQLQSNILLGSRPVSSDLHGIKMLSPTDGYAVGTLGKVLRCDGAAWQNVPGPGSGSLLTVDVSPDRSTVIASGGSGRVYVNSGGGWVTRTLPSTNLIYCCAALSNSTFLVGGSALYRTTDAGAHWSTITVAPNLTGAIRGIEFADSSNGVLVTSSTLTYYTNDGGMTWNPGSGIQMDGAMLYDCSMPTLDEVWAVSSGGSVYKSSNGGASWLKYASFPEQTWYDIDTLPDGSGWAVGWTSSAYGTTAVKRFENGRWHGLPLCTSGSFSAIHGVSVAGPDDAWAVGKAGLILRLGDPSDARFESCDSLAALKSLPDGVNVDLTAAADARVTAVFPECVYLQSADRSSAVKVYTTDGGILWAPAVAGGILATENGERVVRYGHVICGAGGDELGPLGMISRAVGGAPNWSGAPNLALLIRTAGRVTGAGPNWITVDDGSGVTASDGASGIKVLCDTFELPSPLPEFVTVTGVATTELVCGQVYPVIRARAGSDLR